MSERAQLLRPRWYMTMSPLVSCRHNRMSQKSWLHMRMSSFLFFFIAHAVFSRRSRFSIHVASISFLFLYVRVLMDQEAKPRVGKEATLSCASHFFIAPQARSHPRCSDPSCMPRWLISSRVLTISRVFGYRHADVLAWSCICLHTHQQSCKMHSVTIVFLT